MWQEGLIDQLTTYWRLQSPPSLSASPKSEFRLTTYCRLQLPRPALDLLTDLLAATFIHQPQRLTTYWRLHLPPYWRLQSPHDLYWRRQSPPSLSASPSSDLIHESLPPKLNR